MTALVYILRVIAEATKPRWATKFIGVYINWRAWNAKQGWRILTADEERQYPDIAKAWFAFGPIDLDYELSPRVILPRRRKYARPDNGRWWFTEKAA